MASLRASVELTRFDGHLTIPSGISGGVHEAYEKIGTASAIIHTGV